MSEISITMMVDASGLKCPMPLLKAKQALNKVTSGEVICLISTDVNSGKDIAAFVQLTCHELVETSELDGTFKFLLRKGSE